MIYKALSIMQPWAWAILFAGKDVENRDWFSNTRGRIFIHASKTFDYYALPFFKDLGIEVPKELPRGGIVGSVEIACCVTASSSKWFFGKYGFILRNPKALPFMPVRGMPGFFNVVSNIAA